MLGINHALARRLLEAGCSVVIADLALRPESEATVAEYPHPSPVSGNASAVFHRTDVANWGHLTNLWETALKTFGQVHIVVNGAGVYEPPWSSYWNPPGISPLSKDLVDAEVGTYRIFNINVTGPIRLSQIAIDYWLQNREVKGSLLWVSSMGAYVHTIHCPLYFAGKAAIVSFCKCLQGLKELAGIRNSVICPGVVRVRQFCFWIISLRQHFFRSQNSTCVLKNTHMLSKQTPIFQQEYCRDRLGDSDVAATPEDIANSMMSLLTEAKYGNGTVLEVMAIGTLEKPEIYEREVPLEALYPIASPLDAGTKAMEEEVKFMTLVAEKGMRSSC